jgi:hypothetical protein
MNMIASLGFLHSILKEMCDTGVNLLIGTENGLMLLDRSGQGKVYQLISRRRFQQMEVLEGQNILVTISGKKNRVRVYYLSWLRSKILRTDGVSDVGDHNTFHYLSVLQYCMTCSYKYHMEPFKKDQILLPREPCWQ